MTATHKKALLSLQILPLLWATGVHADVVVLDDQIIDGSQCVGVDCVVDEDFGFDTIRLKTVSPVISFIDTSSTASFPANDWRMGIRNDNPSGPAYFYIEDASGGQNVLVLEAQAAGGVALGAGSTLEGNAISVGATGTERRIVNVADGVDPNDAVNKQQLEASQAQVIANIPGASVIDTQIVGLGDRLDALTTRLNDLANRLDNM